MHFPRIVTRGLLDRREVRSANSGSSDITARRTFSRHHHVPPYMGMFGRRAVNEPSRGRPNNMAALCFAISRALSRRGRELPSHPDLTLARTIAHAFTHFGLARGSRARGRHRTTFGIPLCGCASIARRGGFWIVARPGQRSNDPAVNRATRISGAGRFHLRLSVFPRRARIRSKKLSRRA